MPTTIAPGAANAGEGGSRRFTIEEYHRMIRAGILTESDNIELIEGFLVLQRPRGVAHDFAVTAIASDLRPLVRGEYVFSPRCALTLADSEPEPDFTVARGDETNYRTRHPGPADTALVIEVSASSLAFDRTDKARVYARAGIPVYWVVNVIDKQIEVYTQPSGPCDAPTYAKQEVFAAGSSVPVVLDGNTVGSIPVGDVMG